MKYQILPALILALYVSACRSDQQQAASGSSAATGATTEYVEAERIPPGELEALKTADTNGYRAFRGGTVRVEGKKLEVRDASGAIVASNPRLIRLQDEGGDCPSEGFSRIVVNGTFFTVEQQTCGGMFFVNEYITFKAEADGGIYLHKFGVVKTNRSDPNRDIPVQTLTPRDFGKLRLQDADIDRLYQTFHAEPLPADYMAPAAGEDTMAAP
jgi:hypothetical protein